MRFPKFLAARKSFGTRFAPPIVPSLLVDIEGRYCGHILCIPIPRIPARWRTMSGEAQSDLVLIRLSQNPSVLLDSIVDHGLPRGENQTHSEVEVRYRRAILGVQEPLDKQVQKLLRQTQQLQLVGQRNFK